MAEGYGQFCPIAMASEVLTRRWTPLVIRELLAGSHRFNDIRRGVPRMSPTLLSRRLKELEVAGVVDRRPAEGADHPEYHLTSAGEELRPLITQMGAWGRRWAQSEISERHLDAGLLMWDIRRNIDRERVPGRRTVVRFHFEDAPEEGRDFWLVLEPEGVDLCLTDPGHPVDLDVHTDRRTLTRVWLGDVRFAEVLRRRTVALRGPATLRRAFPGWLGFDSRATRA